MIFKHHENDSTVFKNIPSATDDENNKEEFFIKLPKSLCGLLSDKPLDIELPLNQILFFHEKFELYEVPFFVFDINPNAIEAFSKDHIYVSTLLHLFSARVFTTDELKLLSCEQIAELAKYATIDQYNVICLADYKDSAINHALSIRYMLFFACVYDYLHEVNPSEFFEVNDEIISLKDILNLEYFYITNENSFFTHNIDKISTPPTYNFIEMFMNSQLSNSFCSLLDCSEYNQDLFSLIEKEYKDKNEFNRLKDAFNKHLTFISRGHIEAAKNGFKHNFTLIHLCFILDNIHRYKMDKDFVQELFDLKIDSEKDTFVCGWGDDWSDTYFFDLSKGTLFDHWVSHKHEHKDLPSIQENIKYVLNNYQEYLSEHCVNLDLLIHSIQSPDSKFFNHDNIDSYKKHICDLKERFKDPLTALTALTALNS